MCEHYKKITNCSNIINDKLINQYILKIFFRTCPQKLKSSETIITVDSVLDKGLSLNYEKEKSF